MNAPHPPSALIAEILLSSASWHARARIAIRWLAAGRSAWTAEDLRFILDRAGAKAPSPNSYGSVLHKAREEGIIALEGGSVPSRRPEAKSRRLQLWVGVRRDPQ